MDDGVITLASVLFICVFDRMGSFQIFSLNSNWRTNSCLCPLLRHLCSGSDIFHRLVGCLWADRSICKTFIQWLLETWLFPPFFPSGLSLDDWNLLGIARSMAFGGLTHVSAPYNVIDLVQACVTSYLPCFHLPLHLGENWSSYDSLRSMAVGDANFPSISFAVIGVTDTVRNVQWMTSASLSHMSAFIYIILQVAASAITYATVFYCVLNITDPYMISSVNAS